MQPARQTSVVFTPSPHTLTRAHPLITYARTSALDVLHRHPVLIPKHAPKFTGHPPVVANPNTAWGPTTSGHRALLSYGLSFRRISRAHFFFQLLLGLGVSTIGAADIHGKKSRLSCRWPAEWKQHILLDASTARSLSPVIKEAWRYKSTDDGDDSTLNDMSKVGLRRVPCWFVFLFGHSISTFTTQVVMRGKGGLTLIGLVRVSKIKDIAIEAALPLFVQL